MHGMRARTAHFIDHDRLVLLMQARVLDLLYQRGRGGSICPSEAARSLAGEIGVNWHALMRLVRSVASGLSHVGRIEVCQHGRSVDINEARGPVRLRLKR